MGLDWEGAVLSCLKVRDQVHKGLPVPCVCLFVSLWQNSDVGKQERNPM